ncbi:hypothetical protein [Rhodohalobacter mucosus]|uniref:Uncharacterized protein n=1 Tax=Rhodohalobacter mucosus TaxID=2079485 RepID=A0A316TR93_9BACT|nr:hypothetical protein [Rhodohalobacter mucosus]PWN07123.1 hypothetical protein DDZ15_07620 [Rhodohalobacter mucosus]
MRVIFLLTGFLFLTASCTTSRWVVTDEFALDSSAEPEIVDRTNILVLEREPTPENPVLLYTPYEVIQEQYPLRVEMERTVQKYRPRWGFMLLGLAGTLFAFAAANSNTILTDVSRSQKVILNVTGGVLGILSFVNLQPSGDPIYTGESELMRRSGVEVLVDSTSIPGVESGVLDVVSITYLDSVLFRETDLALPENGLEINLASLSGDLGDEIQGDSQVNVLIEYGGSEYAENVRVDQFMAPFIRITQPVATLHSSAEDSEINVVSEVGRDSQMQILAEGEDGWYRVRYENTEAYIRDDAGERKWMALSGSESSLVYEFAEIPFGGIDVESGVPVLKESNPSDKALIVTNGIGNQAGARQYLGRDHDLYRHYSRNAFQVEESEIHTFRERGGGELLRLSETAGSMFDSGSLYIFVTGFADIRTGASGREVVMVYEDRAGEVSEIPLLELFSEIADLSPETLYLFIDLDYLTDPNGNSSERELISLISEASGMLLRMLPNSAIVFSNRPGQQSGLYSGMNSENMRHHIFAYYWAEALQQRKTRLSDLVNHLDSNVDYMSRRLHDRPQEIQAYGNLTLQISD